MQFLIGNWMALFDKMDFSFGTKIIKRLFFYDQTVTTIQVRLPLNGQLLSRTMVMKRHKTIEKLFDENFWVSQ